MKIKPFRGYRPPKELVEEVSSRPYDVLNSEEARTEAAGNAKSLYHIIKPEINFAPGTDEHDPRVYDAAVEQFKLFKRNGWLVQDKEEKYYVYAQTILASNPLSGGKDKTQYGLVPVSIHTRNAFHEMFKVLDHEQDGRLAGVMHCFNGTYDEAKTALSYGFHLGLGGVITYKNCGVKEFLAEIPMDRIVLETDDPYLPPVPYRGQRNEPAYIVKTAEKVAEIYGVTKEVIIEQSTKNAKNIFKI